MSNRQVESVIIGGGQAGLSAGYYLAQRGLPFMILDQNDRIGDAWRKRWDSLRLFTPSRYNGLPGMPFPGSPSAYPTKDETADYLEAYAHRFQLPIQNWRQSRQTVQDRGSFRGDLRRRLVARRQCRGSHRRLSQSSGPCIRISARPGDRPAPLHGVPQPVTTPGRGGARGGSGQLGRGDSHRARPSPPDMALGSGHRSGAHQRRDHPRPPVHTHPVVHGNAGSDRSAPQSVERSVTTFSIHLVASPSAGFEGRTSWPQVSRRVPRTTGVKGGYPLLEDGRVLQVSNVVWCTGFTPGFQWIDLPLPTHNGIPIHNRGIIESSPGLYFIGLLFLYSLSSPLVGGVGRDAKHIVDHLASTRSRSKGEVSGHPLPT